MNYYDYHYTIVARNYYEVCKHVRFNAAIEAAICVDGVVLVYEHEHWRYWETKSVIV